MLVGAHAEVCSWVGLRKGYSTELPLIRRWRCGARVVEEPGLRQPDSHKGDLRSLSCVLTDSRPLWTLESRTP